ncbi:hypothetical protein NDU88_000617 [Pleurodeles waltl]|uniref:Uncharacterized protein n=1 Tax=Pleurodeles waltl TaxID=8319 RepID=A0AAV7Q3M8_PLEWA|nr:hypothetical protein NDU88_000617 [Pleurodeles waltl]
MSTEACTLHQLQKPMPCTKQCPGLQVPTPYISCSNPCPAPSCAQFYRSPSLTLTAVTHALHQAVHFYRCQRLPPAADTHALHQAVPRSTDAYAFHQLQKPMPCTKLCPGLQEPKPYTSCSNPCPAPSCALLEVPTPSTSCRNPCPAPSCAQVYRCLRLPPAAETNALYEALHMSTEACTLHQLQKPMPCTKQCPGLQVPTPYISCSNPCPAPSCAQFYRSPSLTLTAVTHALHQAVHFYRCQRLPPAADTHALHQAVPRSTDAYAFHLLQKPMPCTKLCTCLQKPAPYTSCRNPCPAPSSAQVYRCLRLTSAAVIHALHQAVHSSTGAQALH